MLNTNTLMTGDIVYNVATDTPFRVTGIRDAYYVAGIEKQRAAAEKVAAYYNDCITIACEHSGGNREIVFIKDGRIVACGQFTRDHRGGIYAANNPVQKIPNWNPHEIAAKFRQLNKRAYKDIKRLCTNEPAETFKFDQRTVIKHKS